MKIPKYIEKLIKRRTRVAYDLMSINCKLDDWLINHKIEPDSACWLGGSEIYVNPDIAENEVWEAILNK